MFEPLSKAHNTSDATNMRRSDST